MKNTTLIGLSLLGLLAAKPASGLPFDIPRECIEDSGNMCVDVLERTCDRYACSPRITRYETLNNATYEIKVLPDDTPESLAETLNQHLYLRGDVRVSPAELLALNGFTNYDEVCTPEEEILGLSPSLAYWTATLEHTVQKERPQPKVEQTPRSLGLRSTI